MENWQNELDKARQEGFKQGVTEGYRNGYRDGKTMLNKEAYDIGLEIGYLSHQHDLLDVLETLREERLSAVRILDELKPIEQIREQTKLYTYDHRNKD